MEATVYYGYEDSHMHTRYAVWDAKSGKEIVKQLLASEDKQYDERSYLIQEHGPLTHFVSKDNFVVFVARI